MIEGTAKLYKLMILYMLKDLKHPLSNNRIVDFFTNGDYAGYFTVQEVLTSLAEDEFINVTEKQNVTLYTITERGLMAADQFKDEIAESFRNDIDGFLKKNKYELKNEVSVTSEYFKNKMGEYTCICRVKENNTTLIDLSLTVPLEENARSICDSWKKQNAEVYKNIMGILLQ